MIKKKVREEFIMKTLETKNAPAAIGPYSQAKMVGNFVFASGQIPVDPATGEVAGDKIETQAEQSCKNVGAILEEDELHPPRPMAASVRGYFFVQSAIFHPVFFGQIGRAHV